MIRPPSHEPQHKSHYDEIKQKKTTLGKKQKPSLKGRGFSFLMNVTPERMILL